MFRVINTEKAPAAIGPYSQALVYDNMMFASGQIPINPATGLVVAGGIKEQAQQVMDNVQGLLDEVGSNVNQVIKTTCFLKDMNDFAAFNEVYGNFFVGKPARSCVEAARLPKDVLCEVEVIVILEK